MSLPIDSAHDYPEATTAQQVAWAMYDWANSGFGLIVVSAVFPPFFITQLLPLLPGQTDAHGLVVGSVVLPASAVTGLLNSLSMFLMALGAPILGAVADIKGWTKRLLMLFTITGSVLTMGMYFLSPGQWVLGALLFVVTNFCFGSSFTFFNAFLPRLTRPEKQGSLSGWGFAAGYVGGALALIIVLLMIRQNPNSVTLGLAMSGAWWLLFSLPAFFLLKEFPPVATPDDRGPVLLAGLRRIGRTFRHVRQYRMLFLFLLAFLLYNDGIETVISMSSSFGTDVLRMTADQMIIMLLIVQFVAFVGAIAFGYLSDRLGNKPVILINLAVWVVAVLMALFVTTPLQFTLVGILIGTVLGGVQASSRALMGLLAPRQIHNEAFGFFSISGKFASIFGPLLYSGLATALGPRYGIFSVLPFLIVGMLLLLPVREPRNPGASADSAGSTA